MAFDYTVVTKFSEHGDAAVTKSQGWSNTSSQMITQAVNRPTVYNLDEKLCFVQRFESRLHLPRPV